MALDLLPTPNESQTEGIHLRCADGLPDYIVLDFETSGYGASADQIIEIAMLKFRAGSYASCYERLIKPQGGISPQAFRVHGIALADLANAPRIGDLAADIAAFIGDSILVGHNIVHFDLRFLQDMYQTYLHQAPIFACLDTLQLSRLAFPRLRGHSLSYLADELDIRAGVSHRAMSDVIVTNRLLQCCAEQGTSLQRFVRKVDHTPKFLPMHKRQTPSSHYQAYTKAGYAHVDPNTIPCSVSDFDQSHPFYAKNLVFTGIFQTAREDLIRLAKNRGATVDKNVTLSTHILIVGKQDPQVVGADGRSRREEKAHTYNQAGKTNIVFLCEEDFLRIVKDGGHSVEVIARL